MASKSNNTLHMIAASVLTLLVLTLWLVRINTEIESSGRTIGVSFDPADSGLGVIGVTSGGAADRAGVRVGDVITRAETYEITDFGSYDQAASHFVRGQPVTLGIERGDRRLDIVLVPGRDPIWLPHWVNGFVTLAVLGLGMLALRRRGNDLRARLIAAFCFLLAVELAMPATVIGDPRLQLTITSLFLLITGAQMAIELHLASVTPDRHRWAHRFPWLVPVFYLIGLGFGLVAWTTFVTESTRGRSPFPWDYAQLNDALNSVILPAWAAAVIGILAIPTFRHVTSRGRQQAGLVLIGVLPWGVYVAFSLAFDLLGRARPNWMDDYFGLVILAFPVAVAISIYRYHLFDIELVVRRSFLYTALTSSLVLVFYLALGALGTVFSKVVDEEEYSLWTVAAAMFVVGLLFGNLRRFLQNTVDRLFFPEHRALRRSLVTLASELPARGTVAAMGSHLVERIDEIFAVGGTSLLLADPKSGNFVSVATSLPSPEDRFSLSFLVPADDPSLHLMRLEARPLPTDQALEASPLLAHRFEALGMESSLMAPLLSNDRLVGLLVLGKRERGRRRIPREEIELLSLLTHQIATAFENIRLFESATYESLTGLLRREAILDLLDREIDRAQRYGRPLVVGLADLDFFKSVNDQYGHLAGDAVLRRVAEELQSGLRSTDAVGRYGGEEFLLVFPETHIDGGQLVAEKLRKRIEALRLPMDDESHIDPRISIGLAELPLEPLRALDNDSGSDILREAAEAKVRRRQEQRRKAIDSADKALYRAKREGRNRVAVATLDEAAGGDRSPEGTAEESASAEKEPAEGGSLPQEVV